MRRLLVGLGVLFLGTGVLAAADTLPVLTLCEALSNLSKFDGKQVIVVGRLSSTFEGAWLAEDCGLKIVNADREFPPVISLAYAVGEVAPPPSLPDGFKWDKALLRQKLDLVRRTTRLRRRDHDHWYAVAGRLETHLPQDIKLGNGRIAQFTGFGHLNGSPAQMIASSGGSIKLR
ncbi:MAG TPA: hypothetical protein VGN17_28085 [Bryobacteraceae bacterium]|jgi:hypothetical protein